MRNKSNGACGFSTLSLSRSHGDADAGDSEHCQAKPIGNSNNNKDE